MNEKPTYKKSSSWGRRRNTCERGWPVFGAFAVVFEIALLMTLLTVVSSNQDHNLIDLSPRLRGEDAPSYNNSISKGYVSNELNPDSKNRSICLTPECIHTASRIVSALNRSMNPCDDFYNFACGNFVKSTVIPEDQEIVNIFSEVGDEVQLQLKQIFSENTSDIEKKPFKIVHSLFKSCMDTPLIEARGISPMQIISESLGGWPTVLGKKWKKSSWSWAETIKKIREFGYDTGHIIDLSVTTDVENSSRNALYVDQAILGLSREFLVRGLEDRVVKAYYDYMVDLAILFGAEKRSASKDGLDIVNFEIALANISIPEEERRNKTALYNRYSVKALQERYSYVNWSQYIIPNELNIDENEIVILSSPTFFQQLGPLIEKTPKETIANYLISRIHKYSASYLNEDIQKRQLEYVKALSGLQKRLPRWKECINSVHDRLYVSVGAMYVRKHLNENAKANALEMVNGIRNATENILEENTWMDDQTKEFALNKLRKMTTHIGYPEELLDDSKLEDYYKHLEIDPKEYLESILKINRFLTNKVYSNFRKPNNETDWVKFAIPALVNAYYSFTENSINFPAGILQAKFFSADRPRYMNYGSIGFIIGHEIIHGFDDSGRQFDANGILADWWLAGTGDNFVKKAECIIQQYGNYTDKQTGLKLNGINTQGENIADNGGMSASYKAYNKWEAKNGVEQKLPGLNYSSQQMFWISLAQTWCTVERTEAKRMVITDGEHAPGEFRVLGSLKNKDSFSNDFNCPLGSPMNPVHKCEVW